MPKHPSGFPISSLEKAWTEVRMRWLAEKLGIERLLSAEVVVPDQHHFPEPFHGTEDDAHRLKDRVCSLLGVTSENIELQVLHDVQMPDAAGLYERSDRTVIRIVEANLHDMERLVAVLLHELSHEILLGGGLLSGEEPDQEKVTGLLPVFLGLGIFPANSVFRQSSFDSRAEHAWEMNRVDYLTAQAFGYALALFAFVRRESNPPWASHLRLDAASSMRDGLRYLEQTEDTLFHPETIYETRRPSAADLVQRIKTGTPSAQIAALWEASDPAVYSGELLEASIECLSSPDRHVPAQAASAVGAMGELAPPSISALMHCLHHKHFDARAAAAIALGSRQASPTLVIPELCELMQQDHRGLTMMIAQALRHYGLQAESAVDALLQKLHGALVNCDYQLVDELVDTLRVASPDAEHAIDEHFATDDLELRSLAFQSLHGEGDLADDDDDDDEEY